MAHSISSSGPPLQPTVIQVVRRFGLVGGMEGYVWNLVDELAHLGETVLVLCETCETAPRHPGVQVRRLGPLPFKRPRWIAYLAFSRAVSAALATIDLRAAVVHSHERSADHQLTTLHSEPFDKNRPAPWMSWLSPRQVAYRYMERRELDAGNARGVRVVPVSDALGHALRASYPQVGARVLSPIQPGLTPASRPRPPRRTAPAAGVIGFVGTEWRRKGFEYLLQVAVALRETRPQLGLLVVGPPPAPILAACQAVGIPAQCTGWANSRDYFHRMDLLVHPASSEAYGMVIMEAIAHQVPVVVSDRCGASPDVPPDCGTVLSLEAGVGRWADECMRWLDTDGCTSASLRTWGQVAREYRQVYDAIRSGA